MAAAVVVVAVISLVVAAVVVVIINYFLRFFRLTWRVFSRLASFQFQFSLLHSLRLSCLGEQ